MILTIIGLICAAGIGLYLFCAGMVMVLYGGQFDGGGITATVGIIFAGLGCLALYVAWHFAPFSIVMQVAK